MRREVQVANTVSRRQFLASGAAAATGVALAACGSSSGSGGGSSAGTRTAAGRAAANRVQFTMWSHEGDIPAFLNRRAQELNKMRNSKFRYDPIKVTVVPLGNITTKVFAAATAGGELPDLLGITNTDFGDYALNNRASSVLMDLTERVAPIRDDIFSSSWYTYTADNKIYACPEDYPMIGFYYRPDLTDPLGIKFPIPTWEDVLEIGAKKAAPKGVNLGSVSTGSGGVATAGISDQFVVYLNQRGGNIFGADQKTVTLDSPEAVDAMTLLTEGLKSKTFGNVDALFGPSDVAALKANKEAAFNGPTWWRFVITRDLVPQQKGKWRLVVPPKFSGGGYPTALWGGTGYTATAHNSNPDAAWELLNYSLLSLEGQKKLFTEEGANPNLKAAYQDPFFAHYSDAILGGEKKFQEVYGPLSAHVPPQPQSPYYSQAGTALDNAMADAVSGRKTAQQAITDAAAAIKQAVAQAS